MQRLIRKFVGLLSFVLGFVLLFLPGPGTLFLLLGVLMMSEGTAWGRRIRWKLLRAYVRVRRRTKDDHTG